MKPLIILAAALLFILTSCHHRGHHNTSIHVRENSSTYQLTASYNPNKSGRLQRYLNNKLASSNDASLVHTEMDATITMDDETRFYIQSEPGFIHIKFNKNENPENAYYKVKAMCNGIKEAIQ